METAGKDKKKNKEFEYLGNKYMLTPQTAKIVRDSKFQYSLMFTKALSNGLFTRKKLEEELRKQNEDFFTSYNQKRTDLLLNISETESTVNKIEDPDEIELLSQILQLYRAQLLEEDKLMNDLFSNTADQIAEEERILNVLVGTVKKENGDNVWNSYEELMSESDWGLIEMCKYQVMCSEYNLDPDWQSKLPELKAQNKAKKIRKDRAEEEDLKTKKPKKEKPAKGKTVKTVKKSKKVKTEESVATL